MLIFHYISSCLNLQRLAELWCCIMLPEAAWCSIWCIPMKCIAQVGHGEIFIMTSLVIHFIGCGLATKGSFFQARKPRHVNWSAGLMCRFHGTSRGCCFSTYQWPCVSLLVWFNWECKGLVCLLMLFSSVFGTFVGHWIYLQAFANYCKRPNFWFCSLTFLARLRQLTAIWLCCSGWSWAWRDSYYKIFGLCWHPFGKPNLRSKRECTNLPRKHGFTYSPWLWELLWLLHQLPWRRGTHGPETKCCRKFTSSELLANTDPKAKVESWVPEHTGALRPGFCASKQLVLLLQRLMPWHLQRPCPSFPRKSNLLKSHWLGASCSWVIMGDVVGLFM